MRIRRHARVVSRGAGAACALAVFVALGTPAQGVAGPPTTGASLSAAVPGTYFTDYKQKAKQCSDMSSAVWTSWTTYTSAQVGYEWQVTKGGKVGCTFAKKWADRLIESLPFNDGTGLQKIDWQGYAITVGDKGTSDDPIGHDRPPGWKCYALPSEWGVLAWHYAELGGIGVPNDEAFAPSQGAAAGGGYCVTGARFDGQGDWSGGSFFTWVPDILRCRAAYKLHEREEPAEPEPGEEPAYPSYAQAQIWGSYDRASC